MFHTLTVATTILAAIALYCFARSALVTDRRIAVIDLTNDTHTLAQWGTNPGEQEAAAARLPDTIRTVEALTDTRLDHIFVLTGPADRHHTAQLITTARKELARHRITHPAP